MSGPPQKKQRVDVSSRRLDDDNDRLSSLLPILERMQEDGSLLSCLLSAFEDDRDLLSSRLQHKLPNRWIKAPDQRSILEHIWVIDGYAAYGSENKDDKDGDLEPAPFLIDFRDDKIELGYYAGIKKIRLHQLSVSKNLVFCHIDGGGCGECYNNECYDFRLEQNHHLNQCRLKIKQYVLCRCGGDGDEPCEESSYTATIKQGDAAGGQAPKRQTPATGDQFAEI